MFLWVIFCIHSISQISHVIAYKTNDWPFKTHKLSAKTKNFYTNLDQFEIITNPENPFGSKTIDVTKPVQTLTLNEWSELCPDNVDDFKTYESLSNELIKLLDERNKVNERYLELKLNGNELGDECVQLKNKALELRKLIIEKKFKQNEIKNILYRHYLNLPCRRLKNLPDENPVILNSYTKYIPINARKRNNLLTHNKIIEKFTPPYQKNISRNLIILNSDLSLLEHALISYLLYVNTVLFGFTPISVPYLTSEQILNSTGHLPKFEKNLFKLNSSVSHSSPLYLIPTGEVPLVGMLQHSYFDPKSLPLKLVTYTQCFRNEDAGYGKESKGLLRQHQFGKVELVVVTDSKSSGYWHNLLISQVEFILRSLGITFNTVLLPEKDTPISSAATVDINGFFPAQNKYIELSSISNTTNYQSHKLKINCKKKGNCHILNASGLAIGRLLSCILETNQSMSYGTLRILVPKPLKHYMGGLNYINPPI